MGKCNRPNDYCITKGENVCCLDCEISGKCKAEGGACSFVYKDTNQTACEFYSDRQENMDAEQEYWQQEAIKQCAAAGELRIALGLHLEELRTRITSLKNLPEINYIDQIVVQWKISQLQKEVDWMEETLSKKTPKGDTPK